MSEGIRWTARGRPRAGLLLLAAILLAAVAAPALAEEFDWRAYPGDANLPAGNYITPVRNQGNAGTCWAFAAVGALEAKYDITFKQTNSTLNLSEQHLVCDGSTGTIDGGWEDLATDFVRDHGIVDEATLPYTALNTSPRWPLTQPYTVYRVTSDVNLISPAPIPLKTFVETYGPVMAAIDAYHDWYWPGNPQAYPTVPPTGGVAAGEPGTGALDPSVHGDVYLNHAVVITGFTDDATAPGGGYWHVKNSWGAGWGSSGYGFISYATMEADNYITGIDGLVYTQAVPEPTGLSLLLVLALVFIVRRRVNPGAGAARTAAIPRWGDDRAAA